MFKLITLGPSADAQLQAIQNTYEILAVENLGVDGVQNHYLLVQYDTAPSSASPPSDDGESAKKSAAAKKAGKQ